MKKKTIILAAIIIVLILGGFWLYARKPATYGPNPAGNSVLDPRNATYTIEGRGVRFQNGRAEQEIVPGSASKIVTSIFGEPVIGTIDGKKVAAVMLTQTTGGTGTFYYVAAAVEVVGGMTAGTNAILLGDRIAPQNVEIKTNEIIANYAARKPGEPFSASPSVGVSKYIVLDPATFALSERRN